MGTYPVRVQLVVRSETSEGGNSRDGNHGDEVLERHFTGTWLGSININECR
jgi:hypothetical protein